jgi:hypothetical protein
MEMIINATILFLKKILVQNYSGEHCKIDLQTLVSHNSLVKISSKKNSLVKIDLHGCVRTCVDGLIFYFNKSNIQPISLIMKMFSDLVSLYLLV